MRLQYIASACVLIEHDGVRVLCDPWLTDGIYGGAWYHNPPLKVTPEDFADIDYVYLSHCHPDHLDWKTLERLPRVPVLIGRYVEQFMGAQLRAKGFPVHEIGIHCLGPDFTIRVIPADDCDPVACGKWIGCPVKADASRTSQIDTLAVFVAGGKVIVNVNDCPYELGKGALDHVLQSYGLPDLLCVGYSGAGPWPQCFPQLDEADRRYEAQKKQRAMLLQMELFRGHLKPKATLPFAGQYVLGGALARLNEFRGVPDLDVFDGWGGIIRLPRNGWYDCETATQNKPWKPDWRWKTRLYQRWVLDRKTLDHESDPMPSHRELRELIAIAHGKWQARCWERGFRSGWRIVVQTQDGEAFYLACSPTEPEAGKMNLILDARLLKRLLTRRMHWNNAEIGSLLTFWRSPDVYDRGLMHHLSYLHI